VSRSGSQGGAICNRRTKNNGGFKPPLLECYRVNRFETHLALAQLRHEFEHIFTNREELVSTVAMDAKRKACRAGPEERALGGVMECLAKNRCPIKNHSFEFFDRSQSSAS
jgi:hypothetical protein